ncbi:MAG TPA: hypothetical protein VFE98_05280 [Candidatus Bathyarchaeia archaeon]|nr:hypothetical protein [Candidatus Bathyarchaeia archaeon]
MTVSIDAKPPKSGPGFLRLNSLAYRLEMLLFTIVIVVVLFYWRLFVTRDLNVYLTLFWLVWPDLASFIPIGLAARGSKNWPRWGSTLYNSVHTFPVWILVFTAWSLITGSIQWPLLGWAAYITLDRSAGYYLRARN